MNSEMRSLARVKPCGIKLFRAPTPVRITIGFSMIFALAGCAEYSFDINENEVYTPAPIYTQFSMADSGLKTCIDQTIKDQKIASPLDVTTLQCSFSGITELKGLSKFSRIEQLSLKGNKISYIDELLQLTRLQYLDLSDNPISDCRTLNQLKKLVTTTFLHNSDCKIQ